jgi:hypothetical protein
VLRVQHCFA